jgi:hypothetical protein
VSGIANGQLILGRPDRGELILMVGPAYTRMKMTAEGAGFETRDASGVTDPEELRAGLAASGKSLVVLASAPEVEGRLDRAAFGPLVNLAYAANRVVYGGTQANVVLHPVSPGTEMTINNGTLSVRHYIKTVGEGEEHVGLTLGSL